MQKADFFPLEKLWSIEKLNMNNFITDDPQTTESIAPLFTVSCMNHNTINLNVKMSLHILLKLNQLMSNM